MFTSVLVVGKVPPKPNGRPLVPMVAGTAKGFIGIAILETKMPIMTTIMKMVTVPT